MVSVNVPASGGCTIIGCRPLQRAQDVGVLRISSARLVTRTKESNSLASLKVENLELCSCESLSMKQGGRKLIQVATSHLDDVIMKSTIDRP